MATKNNGAVRQPKDRPLFSRTIRTDQLFLLDIYQSDERPNYVSVCECRKNPEGNFDRISIRLLSQNTVRQLRDALDEVLGYFETHV